MKCKSCVFRLMPLAPILPATFRRTTMADIAASQSLTASRSTAGALASLSLAMLLSSLSTSIANVALPTLSTAFDASFPAV